MSFMSRDTAKYQQRAEYTKDHKNGLHESEWVSGCPTCGPIPTYHSDALGPVTIPED